MKDGTYWTRQGKYSKIHYEFGYQVGVVEGTWKEIHFPFSINENAHANIKNAVLECALETHAPFVGVWTDKKTDIIHIDPSKYIYHRINAVQMAEENNQLSIWDWKNMKEIFKADW